MAERTYSCIVHVILHTCILSAGTYSSLLLVVGRGMYQSPDSHSVYNELQFDEMRSEEVFDLMVSCIVRRNLPCVQKERRVETRSKNL